MLIPLLGAIAAGCTALVKVSPTLSRIVTRPGSLFPDTRTQPAEQAPHTAALIARLLPQYLDSAAYLPVLGAIDQATAVLKLKFDHIFYTGSGGIAKIIARAAAEHLTPLTLELGGKSPAVVFDDADIDTIARRIMWAKYTNAGQVRLPFLLRPIVDPRRELTRSVNQICISVDYVLVTPATEPKLIAAMQRALDSFKADSSAPLTTNADYSRVINDRHYQRLSSLLDRTRGQIAFGGKRDNHERKIDVTVVTGVQADDALMSEEIFGPLLPVVTLPDKDAMIRFIQERETPLALYVFSQSNKNAQYGASSLPPSSLPPQFRRFSGLIDRPLASRPTGTNALPLCSAREDSLGWIRAQRRARALYDPRIAVRRDRRGGLRQLPRQAVRGLSSLPPRSPRSLRQAHMSACRHRLTRARN